MELGTFPTDSEPGHRLIMEAFNGTYANIYGRLMKPSGFIDEGDQFNYEMKSGAVTPFQLIEVASSGPKFTGTAATQTTIA